MKKVIVRADVCVDEIMEGLVEDGYEAGLKFVKDFDLYVGDWDFTTALLEHFLLCYTNPVATEVEDVYEEFISTLKGTGVFDIVKKEIVK